MKNRKTNKGNKISTWWLWAPLKFAIMNFLTAIVLTALYSFISSFISTQSISWGTMSCIFLASVFIATVYALRKLPNETMDRYSFIGLNNIQMFMLFALFIVSTVLIVANMQSIMLKLATMQHMAPNRFFAIMIIVALFYLYLFGLLITNAYAKFRRARAMNIPAWKIICSMPFGFAMLWLPGYLMVAPKAEEKMITFRAKWYDRFTNSVANSPFMAVGTISVLIVMSGYMFDLWTAIIALALGVVFALCLRIRGENKVRNSMGGGYATSAVIINIVLLLCLILTGSIATGTQDSIAPDSLQDSIEELTITEE